MKIFNTLLFLAISVSLWSQERSKVDYSDEVRKHKIDSVLMQLNSWDNDELCQYEDPSLDPGRMTSGETNAWIAQQKKALYELGVIPVWIWKKRCYDIWVK